MTESMCSTEETINLIEEDVRQTGDSATDQAPFVIDEVKKVI